MKIDEHTKISKILKAKPEALEVIASINKHFRKLRSPILRRALAPRVTIKEAAKIGNTTVEEFLRKLEEIGFEVDTTTQTTSTQNQTDSRPLQSNIKPAITLDVRPDIEAGTDPFKKIMATIKDLKPGETIKIINSFEPIPLINLLRQKGFTPTVERPEPGIVVTYLLKGDKAETPDANQAPPTHKDDFDQVVHAFGEDLKVVDVRMMEMPEPMVTILSELETLPKGHGLLVHHKKYPKFLVSELTRRNYQLIEKLIDSNNMDLIIFKK